MSPKRGLQSQRTTHAKTMCVVNDWACCTVTGHDCVASTNAICWQHSDYPQWQSYKMKSKLTAVEHQWDRQIIILPLHIMTTRQEEKHFQLVWARSSAVAEGPRNLLCQLNLVNCCRAVRKIAFLQRLAIGEWPERSFKVVWSGAWSYIASC